MRCLLNSLRLVLFTCLLMAGKESMAQSCSANFTYSAGTLGLVTFTDTSLGTNGTTTYSWSFGGAATPSTSAFGPTVSTTFSSYGLYTVTLQIITAAPSCSSTTTQTIGVFNPTATPPPCYVQVNYTSPTSPTSCNGSATVTSYSTCGAMNYSWSNNATGDTVNNLCMGTYTVIGSSAYSLCCAATATVFTFPPCINPIATFSDTPGPNGSYTFTSTSSNVAGNAIYIWNYGDGSPSSTPGTTTLTSHTYTNNGSYPVTLKVQNPGGSCQDSVVNMISVNSVCIINAGFTYTTGPNGQVILVSNSTGSTTGANYSWSFGPAANPSVMTNGNSVTTTTFNSNGIFPVTLVVVSAGSTCSSTATSDVTINNIVVPPCSVQVNYSPPSPLILCNGSATLTPVGACSPLTYSWVGGASSTATGLCANTNYTVVIVSPNPLCCSSAIQTFSIPGCSISSAFTHSSLGGGSVFFNSISTGTVPGSTYSWYFGDTSATASGQSTTHTYTNNGAYWVTLFVTNPGGCSDSTSALVSITSLTPCNLSASFSYSALGNGRILYTSLSTGTTPSTSYTWNFGDGSPPFSAINRDTISHQYYASMTFAPSLTITTNPATSTCSSTYTGSVHVVVPCLLSVNFSHTVMASGLVNFTDLSAGTYSGTPFFWDFGDGTYSTSQSPSHTYQSAGVYDVTFSAFNDSSCSGSMVRAINITGIPCVANSAFSLAASAIPQYWNATPAYPWNVIDASWDWGDGSPNDTLLYTSHTYSTAGNYNICLSVTVSCGSTGSTCASYAVYKTSQQNQAMNMIYVNVLKPALQPVGIESFAVGQNDFRLFPNPSTGDFRIELSGAEPGEMNISIYSPTGQLIFENASQSLDGTLSKDIRLGQASNGLYLVKISSGSHASIKKLLISN